MADEVGRLAVVLDARIGQFEAKVAKAEARLKRGAGNMTRSAKSAENSFLGMTRQLGAFAGVLAGSALTTGFNRLLTQLDNIGKTADKLGLTTTALQELRSAAEQSGVGVNTLDMAMQRFGRRVAEARQGTGEARAALAEMGIALTDAAGQARPLEDVLDDVADRMSGMTEQTDRNRLAMKLFDSEGVALVNMLKNGSAGLREMRDAATGVIPDEAIRNAEVLRTEIDLLVQHIQGKALVAVGTLATAINHLLSLGGGQGLPTPEEQRELDAYQSRGWRPINPTNSAGGGGGGGGGTTKSGGANPFDASLRTSRDRLEQMAQELHLIGQTERAHAMLSREYEVARIERELLTAAEADGRVTEEEREAIREQARQYRELSEGIEIATRAQKEMEDAQKRAADAMEDQKKAIEAIGNAFTAGVGQADSFKDALKGVALQLLNLGVQGLFGAGPLAGAIGGAVSGLSFGSNSLVPNARGNAVSGGRVQPFAKGGIVSSPTLFGMAGGTGLMGEAGPEAIMPLKRGSGGRLGVQGGQVEVLVSLDDSMLNARIVRTSEGVSARAVGRLAAARSESKAVLA